MTTLTEITSKRSERIIKLTSTKMEDSMMDVVIDRAASSAVDTTARRKMAHGPNSRPSGK